MCVPTANPYRLVHKDVCLLLPRTVCAQRCVCLLLTRTVCAQRCVCLLLTRTVWCTKMCVPTANPYRLVHKDVCAYC